MRPLRRSASGITTLTMLNRRSTKYKYYIGLITVFLIITSTIVMFTAITLIWWYMMRHLGFWDDLFVEAPFLMLGVGIYTFLVSFYGFFISTSGNRGMLISFAVLLSIACLAQIVSVFIFNGVKEKIENFEEGISGAKDELNQYWEVSDRYSRKISESWDTMQRHLHCCGVKTYKDWKNTRDGVGDDVPDTCCFDEKNRCGIDVIKEQASENYDRIYMTGCFEMLKDWMEEDVEPLIDVYAALGAITAIIELVAIALAAAYTAQITRKQIREERIHLDQRFPTSPGFGSNGQILLDIDSDSKPEYESSRNESVI